mmetsp:Transcript_21893/g.46867  ORF Transcript_21893/g.46867 Transcript_21893/m.46867 type:complete len:313 (-) Transcript_21893:73-1011(-)
MRGHLQRLLVSLETPIVAAAAVRSADVTIIVVVVGRVGLAPLVHHLLDLRLGEFSPRHARVAAGRRRLDFGRPHAGAGMRIRHAGAEIRLAPRLRHARRPPPSPPRAVRQRQRGNVRRHPRPRRDAHLPGRRPGGGGGRPRRRAVHRGADLGHRPAERALPLERALRRQFLPPGEGLLLRGGQADGAAAGVGGGDRQGGLPHETRGGLQLRLFQAALLDSGLLVPDGGDGRELGHGSVVVGDAGGGGGGGGGCRGAGRIEATGHGDFICYLHDIIINFFNPQRLVISFHSIVRISHRRKSKTIRDSYPSCLV